MSDLDEKLKEILATIIRDGQFQSAREFVIYITEHFDPQHSENPMQARLSESAERIKQAFIDAGWLDPTKVESVVMRNVGTVSEKYACRAEDCYLKGDHYHAWSGKVYDV